MRREKYHVNIRRLLAVAFVLCLLTGIMPRVYAEEASGSCGDNLSWSLSGGTLTISGAGDMWNYTQEQAAPWTSYSGSITALVLPEGLTSVGDYAFAGCSGLKAMKLPDSVSRIGWRAFSDCVNLTMVDLGSGLKSIGESAFLHCQSLESVLLPYGLESIGFQAFFRCYSLQAVTVPASVTKMGMTVFAYCENLVYADIQAQISELPDWTFFGCEKLGTLNLPGSVIEVGELAFHDCQNLSTVYYPGDQEQTQSIIEDIQKDLPAFGSIFVTDNKSSSGSVSTFTTTDDETTRDITTVTQTENATVSTVITQTIDPETGAAKGCEAEIEATVKEQQGWQELVGQVESTITVQNQLTQSGTVEVTVNSLDEGAVDASLLSQLAGKNVELTVQTASGSAWTVDLSTMEADNLSGLIDLSYTLSEQQTDEVDADGVYTLQFAADSQVNAEVMIRLPAEEIRKEVTLLYFDGSQWTEVQSTVVDNEGYAHFYLASVSHESQYSLSVNYAGQTKDVIVPDSLRDEFDITDTLAPMDYVITGRTSSWNMNIGQVTWIMIGVLIGSVAIIGVVLFMLNKRKLKKGYVVDLDEYEIN